MSTRLEGQGVTLGSEALVGVLGANKARGPGGYSKFTEGVGALDIMLFSYVRKILQFQETY